MGLKVELRCSTTRHLALYGFEEAELQHEGHTLDAAGAIYILLTKYKRPHPVTPSPLSNDTPRDKRNLPMEKKFKDALKRECSELTEGEKTKQALSEPEDSMDMRTKSAEEAAVRRQSPDTTKDLLQDLSEKEWANMATAPVRSSRKNLELQL